MMGLFKYIRDTWHPLHNLRRIGLFRRVASVMDIPMWKNIYGIRWKVQLKLVRDATYWWNARTPEPEIFALFVAIQDLFSPSTFWDIGAYIGIYSYLLKSRDEKVEVIMFDPDPVNLRSINCTVSRAKVNGIQIFPYAV